MSLVLKQLNNALSDYVFADFNQYLAKKMESYNRIFFITDDNLEKHYKASILQSGNYFSFEHGEQNKTLGTVESIYNFFTTHEANRSDLIIGFGGGIVSDITGFAAATFKRGLDFGFIPTTLLSMVDASIGGKNGINYKNYKNMVGSIVQPKFICVDVKLLDTLPKRDFTDGFAEIIKSAAIADSSLIETLSDKQYFDISDIILKVAKIKFAIVTKDVKENGLRKVLNFGHTIAHAIEKEYAYSHGVAVAWGMIFASELSFSLGLLCFNKKEILQKLIRRYFDLSKAPIEMETISDAIKFDKKRKNDYIDFVLLQDIGSPIIKSISINNLTEMMHAFCYTR